MKTVPVQQGSVEWLEARCGIPTASEFDCLISPDGKLREGETPKTFLCRKLAEAWSGPLPGFGSFATEQGQILEGEAIPWVEFEFGWKVERVGLVTTDDGRIGCSPDGLIGDYSGVEIKCPSAEVHVKCLLKNEIPKDHIAQVQGAMFVTGRKEWQFVSYRRHLPALVLTVTRDEMFQEKLAETLETFLGKFDRCMARLIELNGGPPPPRVKMVFADDIAAGRGQESYEEIGITP